MARTGYFRLRTWAAAHGETVPDAVLYQPLYSPWLGDPDFERVYAAARGRTLVSRDRCYVLLAHADPGPGARRRPRRARGLPRRHGAARGDDGRATVVGERPLHLVDSFAGMPRITEGTDRFEEGDLGSTSAESVRTALAPFPFARVHEGVIPGILDEVGVERVTWAHIDVDVYAAVRDCLEYLSPAHGARRRRSC